MENRWIKNSAKSNSNSSLPIMVAIIMGGRLKKAE
jgi:hypothetical protein